MSNRACPECSMWMSEERNNWVVIDKCNYCHWVFLDFWEIKEIIEKVKFQKHFEKVIKWDFKRDNLWKDIICANCWEVMDEREYIYWSWNHINFCTSCWSIYLDEWELKEVQDFEISRIHSKEWRDLIKKLESQLIDISQGQQKTLNDVKYWTRSIAWVVNSLPPEAYSTPWILYWILSKIFRK